MEIQLPELACYQRLRVLSLNQCGGKELPENRNGRESLAILLPVRTE